MFILAHRGRNPSGGPAPFSPASLFAAGENGVWYDPSDFSSMFQDSAGTTPVTAVGDPVGRINDKSGNGFHATQATSTKRPLLQQDAGGKYYLDFDGVDDALGTASIDLTTTDTLSVSLGVSKDADAAASSAIEFSVSSSANTNSFYVLAPGSATPNYQVRAKGSADNTASFTTYTAPITNTIFATLKSNAANLAAAVVARINGSPATNNTVISAASTGNFGNYPLYIGSRAASSLYLNGRIYGLIIRDKASSAGEITDTEAWMNGKTGAY